MDEWNDDLVDALDRAEKAEAAAEALEKVKGKALEIMALEDDETEENLTGYGRGSYFAAKCILALTLSDREGKEKDDDE